jgi:hypothetical protein
VSPDNWTAFVSWCSDAGRSALPATPETVAAFLAAAAGEKYRAGARGWRGGKKSPIATARRVFPRPPSPI